MHLGQPAGVVCALRRPGAAVLAWQRAFLTGYLGPHRCIQRCQWEWTGATWLRACIVSGLTGPTASTHLCLPAATAARVGERGVFDAVSVCYEGCEFSAGLQQLQSVNGWGCVYGCCLPGGTVPCWESPWGHIFSPCSSQALPCLQHRSVYMHVLS